MASYKICTPTSGDNFYPIYYHFNLFYFQWLKNPFSPIHGGFKSLFTSWLYSHQLFVSYSFTCNKKTPPPHRNYLSADPDGLMSGVAEEVSVNGNGLSLPFVGPACVVPEHTTRGSGQEAVQDSGLSR